MREKRKGQPKGCPRDSQTDNTAGEEVVAHDITAQNLALRGPDAIARISPNESGRASPAAPGCSKTIRRVWALRRVREARRTRTDLRE